MDRPFRSLLDQHRPSVEREVFNALGALNDAYRNLPDDKRADLAARIVGLLLLAYDDPRSEELYRTVFAMLERRREQGISLRDALTVVALPRRAICDVLRQTYPDGYFHDDIERLTRTVEDLSATIIEAYDQRTMSAMEERAAAERRYRLLYDLAPVMIHSIDGQGRLIEINEEWAKVLGYTKEEALGRKSIEFMTESSREMAINVYIPQMMKDGYIRDVHYQFVRKNGEIIDVWISAMVVKTNDGKVERVVGVLLDVTERLRTDRALRANEEQYRSIVERSPLGICIHRAGTIVYSNAAMQRLVGVTVENALNGEELLTFTHPDFHEATLEQIQSVEKSADVLPAMESKLLRTDGEIVDVEVFHQPVMYEGSPAVQFVYLDVSARKRAEDALRRAAASENTLAAQEEMIRALSCPLIPFGKGALLMPLIGNINHGRAARIIEELAGGVVAQQATTAILDVTGVPHVDADVADALLRAGSVARLLGADVILTGIQPSIAKVIVELGIDMSGFTVKSSLREGLSQLMRDREWMTINQRGRG